MYSIAFGWAPGYEECTSRPRVKAAVASWLSKRMRGKSDVPVCKLSDRVIRIQFSRNSCGRAATNSATVFTLLPGPVVRKVFIPDGDRSVSEGTPASSVKLARTERIAFIVTVQVVAMPAQSPPHPANVEPVMLCAVSVMDVVEVSLQLVAMVSVSVITLVAVMPQEMLDPSIQPLPRPVFMTRRSAAWALPNRPSNSQTTNFGPDFFGTSPRFVPRLTQRRPKALSTSRIGRGNMRRTRRSARAICACVIDCPPSNGARNAPPPSWPQRNGEDCLVLIRFLSS